MTRKGFFFTPLVFLTLLCRERPQWPNIVISPWFDELRKTEARLAREIIPYEDYEHDDRFHPEGIYSDRQRLFVWSSRHPTQKILTQAGNVWKISGSRRGPLKTRRCIFIPDHNIGSVCLGTMQPKGLAALDSQLDFGLEDRAGYADFSYAEGRFFVADAVSEKILILDHGGKRLGESDAPGIYAVFASGKNIVHLSYRNPRLVVSRADAPGKLTRVASLELDAPVRDLYYDAVRGYLWTVGPKNEIVSRPHGGIDNLSSHIYAYKLEKITDGRPRPLLTLDLGSQGIVDAVALTPAPRGLLVAARGSSKYALVEERGDEYVVRTRQTGDRGISALFYRDSLIFSAGFFSDTLRVFPAEAGERVANLKLSAAPDQPKNLFEAGEWIFYWRAIARDAPQNQFSCESCHWDRLTDHRIHFGGGGTQGLMRPPRGIGMVSHPMPDMEYDSISKLVEEFFKAMDYDFWEKPRLPETHWHGAKTLFAHSDVPVTLPGREARMALLTYLMQLPVERPLLRKPGEALSREAMQGFDIFWRDCARCHEPVTSMRERRKLSRAETLRHLKTAPLVFGAPLYARTGLPHQYTENGTRINPLTNLGRGGPFLSMASAENLRDLLRGTNPNTKEVHFAGGKNTFYTAAEIQALVAFLLSI